MDEFNIPFDYSILDNGQSVADDVLGEDISEEEIRLLQSEIDLSLELKPPQVCLEIVNSTGQALTIGSLGEFTLLIGKAKSRKTFLITVFLAAVLVRFLKAFGLKANLPINQNVALYFDTEQGNYHVQRSAKRVLQLSGKSACSEFRVFSLRKYKPSERLQIIEYALYNTPGIGFVVIDGIRDLITSINDEEQATMITSKLLKWTAELNIHIVCVLHQNKGDTNARGHAGTELQNKAQSVLSCTKDTKNKDISIVEAEYCRDKDFEPFAFEIDGNGLPIPVEFWSNNNGEAKKQIQEELPIGTHLEIIKAAFSHNDKPKYQELITQIKIASASLGNILSDSKAKHLIQFYMNKGLIEQKGKAGTRHSYYIQCNQV